MASSADCARPCPGGCEVVQTVRATRASLDPQGAMGVRDSTIGDGGSLSLLAPQRPRRAALNSLKRLVEQHLASSALSAKFICARSGWSRATVYRLFEPEGGLARYIRKQHLLHAFHELTSGQPPNLRILDLALAHQFASEASFNRAFRRAFGIPPGKARSLALSEGGLRAGRRIVAGSGFVTIS